MDAQELQRLEGEQQKAINDMLVHGTGFTVGGKHVPTETVMMFSNPEVTRTTPEAPVAERAVSPAESVQSDDLLKLQDLIGEVCRKYNQASYTNKQTDDVVAFGRAEKLLIEYIDASRAAAHAEGRRSAMEELAKEKERADRAEARIAEVVASATASVDSLTKERTALVTQLSSRQAPDWSKLTMLTPACPNGVATMMPQRMGSYVLLSDVKALLAQPLQQQGGKKETGCKRWCGDDECKDACVNRTPQQSDNLQQASTAQAEQAKEDTFETGYKNLVFVLRCIASGHHNSEELARNVLKHGLLPDTAAPAQATPEGAGKVK